MVPAVKSVDPGTYTSVLKKQRCGFEISSSGTQMETRFSDFAHAGMAAISGSLNSISSAREEQAGLAAWFRPQVCCALKSQGRENSAV
jgi:hypothetical protein